MARTVYDYSAFAWCYESIASVYSLGAIARVKASQIASLSAGDRVLYVGVGAGEDALLASRVGALLTCIDVSPRMLARLRARLERDEAGMDAVELVLGDLFEFEPGARFDFVIANFVLNLYAEPEMRQALARMRSWLAPGGSLMIADFALPAPAWVWISALYYRPVNWMAWLLGLCELHPIHDYARCLSLLGLEVLTPQRERDAGLWPRFFESVRARDVGA